MPAVSKSQQRLMAMAYHVKKFQTTGGREGMDPLEIQPEYRREVEDLAASMKMSDLKDYAETEHKNLPERVKEGMTGFLSAGPFPAHHRYASMASTSYIATNRDMRDPLIKKFMEYINGKEEKETEEVDEAIAALGPPGVATPQGTPGMGNVTAPSHGNVGSGDKFGDEEDEVKHDAAKQVGIMSYEDYKKWLKKWLNRNTPK